jgi:hypothetical protein
VAEGGVGGSNPSGTSADCSVIPPVGPYTGSPVGSRISRIDHDGERTVVADKLPSSQTSPALGSLVSGVADIAFIDGKLYGILAGAGCSHVVPSVPNGVIRVHRDGGPDGDLYISNVGFGPPPVGLGEIIKVQLHEDD